jgi:hypothetical protein
MNLQPEPNQADIDVPETKIENRIFPRGNVVFRSTVVASGSSPDTERRLDARGRTEDKS